MEKTNDRFEREGRRGSPAMTNRVVEVVIVGAGAAGIGCGVVLKDLGIENFVILERHQVGASFSRWAEEMRFITPSFPSHGFGLLDLNAVVLNTSPALSFRKEHLSGKEYALYLETVAEHFQLPVKTETDVKTIAANNLITALLKLFFKFLGGISPKSPFGQMGKKMTTFNFLT